MGVINNISKGNPSITHSYEEAAESGLFNKALLGILQLGIYQGCTLSVSAGLNPVLSPGVLFIQTNNGDWANTLGVRVEFQNSYEIAGWSVSTPYVVIRYFWAPETNAYPDILCVAAPSANDIIVGKITSISSPSVFILDSTQRMQVSYAADGIDLHTGLTSSPTGGTTTNLSGLTTIWNALNTIFSRLIDMSGVQNGAVDVRLLNTSSGHIDASTFLIDAAFAIATNPIVATDTIQQAIGKLAAGLNNASGITSGSIGASLLNLGVGAGKISSSVIPSSNTDAFGVTATPAASLANTDTISGAITKIVSALKNLSGVADGAVLQRHISFGNGAGQVNGTQIPVGQALTIAPANTVAAVSIAAADSIPAAIGKLLAAHSSEDAAIIALQGAIAALTATVNNFTANINAKEQALPIGSVIMYDAANWKDSDDPTPRLPGWYACTQANEAKSLGIPNLEDLFVVGSNVAGYQADAGLGHKVGPGTVSLVAANLPSHTHNIAHTHSLIIDPDTNAFNNSSADHFTSNDAGQPGLAMHDPHYTRSHSHSGTTGQPSNSNSDGGAGLNASAITLNSNIRRYRLIYIKKVS
jgi:hypothetical protein